MKTLEATLLTAGSDTSWHSGLQSRSTASIDPTPDALVFLAVRDDAPPTTVEGCGLEWQLVIDNDSAAHFAVWKARATDPIAGPVTINDLGPLGAGWIAVEVTGVKTNDAAIAEVTESYRYGDFGSCNFDGPLEADNRTLIFTWFGSEPAELWMNAGWTELGSHQAHAPTGKIQAQWNADTNDDEAGVTASDGTRSSVSMVGVALAPIGDLPAETAVERLR